MAISRFGRLVTLVMAGAALAASGHSADLQEIKERGVLRVIALEEEQPELFQHGENPERPGFYREVVGRFAKVQGLEMQPVIVKTVPERITALLEGRGDLVVGMAVTEERRKKIAFSEQVLPAFHLVVNKAPAPPINDPSQLPGLAVGTLPGSSWEHAALEAGIPRSALVDFSGTDDLLQALEDGTIAAIVIAASELVAAQERHPTLQAGMRAGEVSIDAWGLRPKDHELKAACDEFLAGLRLSGVWSQLVVKYFGENALEILGRAR